MVWLRLVQGVSRRIIVAYVCVCVCVCVCCRVIADRLVLGLLATLLQQADAREACNALCDLSDSRSSSSSDSLLSMLAMLNNSAKEGVHNTVLQCTLEAAGKYTITSVHC